MNTFDIKLTDMQLSYLMDACNEMIDVAEERLDDETMDKFDIYVRKLEIRTYEGILKVLKEVQR